MEQLIGYTVSTGAQLEVVSPRELIVFIEHKIHSLPDVLNKEQMLVLMNKELKEKFGQKFSASLIDAVSGLPEDGFDEALILLVDAPTFSTVLQ